MISSMTGFSSTIISLPVGKPPYEQQLSLSMSLKTLNSRFFEVNCKMPYSLAFLETELIKYFKSQLHRGNVVFTVYMGNVTVLTGTIEPSLPTVDSYLKSLDTIKESFSLKGDIGLKDLLTLPDIFQTKEEPLDPKLVEQIRKAIYTLTEECIAVRHKEGEALKKDLLGRISSIKSYLEKLEPRATVVIEQKKEQLFATLKTVLDEVKQEASENQSNLIFNQLERIDIHEEIVRFKTHLGTLSLILEKPGAENGKKLDFTLQELFREINTITSKCNDAEISSLAINIKVELEKAREQAQNIV